MTHRPHTSWNIVDRPDLPEYELNKACPVTGEVTGLERHHISPRSAGTRSWWVELEDGTVVGNIVNLSPSAHYRVTVNKARISYEDGLFYWEETGEKAPLRWQPPVRHKDWPEGFQWSESEGRPVFQSQAVVGDTVYDMHTHEVVQRLGPQPGETCGFCKRRIPHPKKATSPKTKVYSTRVPVDDVETFKELVDTAAEHMGAKSRPHHEYWTLLTGLTLLLQAPKEELPGG